MKYAAFAFSALLAGCNTAPLTPQEAAVIMQMNQNMQANNNAMMQNMQNNPVYQRQAQPVYTAPARPLRCTTRHIGGTSYTDCY
jgi:hypothetical protein